MAASVVDVRIEVKAAAADLKNYQRKKLPTAARLAVNKAIVGGKTDTKNELKKRISMRVGVIAPRIKVTKAKAKAKVIEARLSVPKRRHREFSNLGSFTLQKVRRSIRGKRRLSASGLGAKVYGERKFKRYRGAFLWERPSGAKTVFKRVKNAPKVKPSKRVGGDGELRRFKRGPKKGQVIKRQPVEAVFGTSVTREFVRTNRTDFRDAPIDIVRRTLRTRFIREFERQLRRIP